MGFDGEFAETVRAALRGRGLSLRAAARALHYDHAYLCRVLSGKQPPSPQLAQGLDELLGTGDSLAQLAGGTGPEDADRVARVLANPARIDGRTVEALGEVLAAQRRLDDALGPTPLLSPTESQMALVLGLLREAGGIHRQALCEVAAESVQFAGWLHASARRDTRAVRLLSEAIEIAAAAENGSLTAQAYNFRGYLARQQGRPDAVVHWFTVAYRTPGAHPAQRMGDAAQAAQGHAELGESDAARRLLDEAVALSDAAASGQPPGTAYWLTPSFQHLSLGLAHLSLHAYADAADLLSTGLQGLPAEQQHAAWSEEYREALTEAEGLR